VSNEYGNWICTAAPRSKLHQLKREKNLQNKALEQKVEEQIPKIQSMDRLQNKLDKVEKERVEMQLEFVGSS